MNSKTNSKKLLLFGGLAVVLVGTFALASAFAFLNPFAAASSGTESGRVILKDGSGNEVGTAKFTGVDDGVMVSVSVSGLAPGFHGFHVHTIGDCTGPSFTSAGGHYNPDSTTHRHHAGDLPVLLVNEDGSAEAKFVTDRFTLAELDDENGSALIIHANPDNYANIPTDRYDPDPDSTTLATGDAGARVACGVIT
jgi:Cu-Zn family superoxide dismutase